AAGRALPARALSACGLALPAPARNPPRAGGPLRLRGGLRRGGGGPPAAGTGRSAALRAARRCGVGAGRAGRGRARHPGGPPPAGRRPRPDRKEFCRMNELVLDRVTKHYGAKIACDRVSLRAGPGVYGLLGANGAGKTTLLRMICGVLRPTAGSIQFAGLDVASEGYRARLGYLPQDFGYYPEFTALDFLLYLAALKGLPRAAARS